jgi:hypothetical protein
MKPIPGTLQEGGASFQTTQWTLILSAQKNEQKGLPQQALSDFCNAYWPPLYAFLRLASHPEAFADHGAEFWLGAGTDPDKALRLAKMNLEVRNTPGARRLLARAVAAKASFVDSSGHAGQDFVFKANNTASSSASAVK